MVIPHSEPTDEAESYRGPDRRARVETTTLGVRAARPAILILVFAIGWVLAVAIIGSTAFEVDSLRLAGRRLEIAGGAFAILAGVMCALRWRLRGSASSLWLALALLVLSLHGIAFADYGNDADGTAAATLAVFWVAAGLVACAIRCAEVDTSVSLVIRLVGTLAALAGAFVAAAVVVIVGVPIVVVGVVTGLVYLVLARSAFKRMRHLGFVDGGWLATVLVALGAAIILRSLDPSADGLDALGAAVLGCTAFALAAVGSLGVSSSAAIRDRSHLLHARIEHAEEAQLRHQLEDGYAERLHELRSSVIAVTGGVRSIEPLAASDTRLTRALEAELARLQELVSPDNVTTTGIVFDLEEAIVPTLEVCEAAGWPVIWNIPADLHVTGRPAGCAQVIHALVANAHRHAAGTPIEVSATTNGQHATVRVEDRGPGVPRAQRDLIFERGFRGDPDGSGFGLGLAVARRLTREQGGELWVESRAGGGATFVMLLPAGAGKHAGSTPAAEPSKPPALRLL